MISWWLIRGCEDDIQILCGILIVAGPSIHHTNIGVALHGTWDPTPQHALTSHGPIPDAPILWQHLLEYLAKLKGIESSPKVEVPIIPASNISSGTIIFWSRCEERSPGKSNRYNPYSTAHQIIVIANCHISIDTTAIFISSDWSKIKAVGYILLAAVVIR